MIYKIEARKRKERGKMSSEKNTDAEMLIQKGYKLKIPQLMH